jgi:hypothetical protein
MAFPESLTRILLQPVFTRSLSPTLALLMGALALLNTSCESSRISGTYIARTPALVDMLQLTQTDHGRITGVLSGAGPDGKVSSGPVEGAIDGDQLTLTHHGFLFAVSGSGTIRGNTIQLFSDGQSMTFKRGSPSDFQEYVKGLVLNRSLVRRTRELHQTVPNAEKWISYGELHARRIPRVQDYYRKIEDRMRSLVREEQTSSNFVHRTQVSAAVIQGKLAGDRADLEVNQMWDRTIGDSGQTLRRIFQSLPSNCWVSSLKLHGAPSSVVAQWLAACRAAQTEREKFEPVFGHIMEQRAQLKSFERTAASRRESLVDESQRVAYQTR